jgi:hypothetical protein
MEIITTTIIHMNLTPFPTISSPFIMYPYLKDVSITCISTKNNMPHVFMLMRRMLLNLYI